MGKPIPDLDLSIAAITKETACYLVSLDLSGTYEIQAADCEIIGRSSAGITRPLIVTVNGKRGFLKDSSLYDEGDDLEFLINAIGRYLDIPMAEEYRVLNRNMEKDSFLSMDVASGAGDTFYEMSAVRQMTADRVLKNNEILQPWMIDWGEVIQHPAFPDIEGAFEYLCESESAYDIAINFPVYLLEYYFGKNKEALELFRKRYFEMLMFDIFVGQVDRTMENYGIITDQTWKEYSMAPLFDCATLAKPYLPDNIYVINELAADRETLFRILATRYHRYIIPMADKINQRIPMVFPKITELAGVWIENENSERLIANIRHYFEMAKKYLGEEYDKTM